MWYLFALKTPTAVGYTCLRQSDAVDHYVFTHRRRKLDMTLRGEVSRQSTFAVDEDIFDMRGRVYRDDTELLISHKLMAVAYHGHLIKGLSSPHADVQEALKRIPGGYIGDYRVFDIDLEDVPWREDGRQGNEFYLPGRYRIPRNAA